ncbi:hypothetical protein UY3_07174 [Chelonia mydas]|uniref:Uncharacterized protein n=1 Tax=Chelonia mydas TaxID=8469 RepID=M7C569_CHEMY|nr:hypothetical protein UY3_07174 [Chelonia mydas]
MEESGEELVGDFQMKQELEMQSPWWDGPFWELELEIVNSSNQLFPNIYSHPTKLTADQVIGEGNCFDWQQQIPRRFQVLEGFDPLLIKPVV